MNCSNCSTDNEPGYRFCRECGRSLSGDAGSAVTSAGEPVPTAPAVRRAWQGPVAAVVAGVALIAGSLAGLMLTRPRPKQRPPSTQVATVVPQIGPAPLTPGPAPVAQNPAPAKNLSSPRPFVGPVIPPALADRRRREGFQGELAPAGVRRVEPGAAESEGGGPAVQSVMVTPLPGPGGEPAAGGPGGTGSPERVAAAPGAPGSPFINIQVLEGGGAPAEQAAPAPQKPAALNVTVEPLEGLSPLAEARQQLQAGRRHAGQGRYGAAREAFTNAARLFRLVADRGGSEAAAARQGLAEAERGLRASRRGNGQE